MFSKFTKAMGFFAPYVGGRAIFFVLILALAGLAEALSLTLLLPLLSGTDGDNPVTNFFRQMATSLGLEFTLPTLLLFIATTLTLRGFFLVYQASYTGYLLGATLKKIREDINSKLFAVRYDHYLKHQPGSLANALVHESFTAVGALGSLAALAVAVFFEAIYVAIPLTMEPKLMVMMLLGSLPLGFLVIKVNTRVSELSQEMTKSTGRLNQLFIQGLSFFKYFKATHSHPKLDDLLKESSDRVSEAYYKQRMFAGISQYGFEPYVVILLCLMIYFFVHLSGGELTRYLFVFFLLHRAMQGLLNMQTSARKFLGSWGSIELLDQTLRSLDQEQEKPWGQTRPDFSAPLQVREVSYGFSQAQRDAVSKVSLTIKPGEAVAIVGESGSGKSTLANMLIGLLEPTSGEILVGGVPYRDLDRRDLRKQMAYVQQENMVFSTDVASNVTLWEETASNSDFVPSQRLQRACQIARLDTVLKQDHRTFASQLNAAGTDISGGQRQRLNIARELYKKSPILILDEATSSLDPRLEEEILANLLENRGERTLVAITHRLGSVRHFDRILVLKQGQLIQDGPYETLLESGGELRSLLGPEQKDL